jgi:hypothetical protein
MNLNIYDNKIFAPLKHGTRFLSKIFPTYVHANTSNVYREYLVSPPKNPIWCIYRDPMEHLVSALHSEIITMDTYGDLTISDVMNKFTQLEGTMHWNTDILKDLYYTWDKVHKNGFNIVELKELSNLLIELGYNVPEYDYEEFQFHHLKGWVSKEDIVLMVQMDFPKEWEYLMSIVESENEFYYKLNNKIRIPIKLI